MASPLRWKSGAASDIRAVRARNEDRYWVDDEHGVFLVADGVGGQAAGELAAETAVEVIRDSLSTASGDAEERVRRAITRANNCIFDLRARNAKTCAAWPASSPSRWWRTVRS